MPDVFTFDDLDEYFGPADSIPKYLLEPLFNALQKISLRIALNIAHEDWRLRKERTRQGIEQAKAKGKYKGSNSLLEK